MNEKQKIAVKLAEEERDHEFHTREQKVFAIFGMVLLATRLGAGSLELDELWRELSEEAE